MLLVTHWDHQPTTSPEQCLGVTLHQPRSYRLDTIASAQMTYARSHPSDSSHLPFMIIPKVKASCRLLIFRPNKARCYDGSLVVSSAFLPCSCQDDGWYRLNGESLLPALHANIFLNSIFALPLWQILSFTTFKVL